MVSYAKLQQWTKEESQRPTGEMDQIKFIDLRFERWQVVRFRNIIIKIYNYKQFI